MASLTLVVLTYNEESNLARCLESVTGLVQRAVIVDSGSDDATRTVAVDHGASVVVHPFENQAKQFNWALSHLRIQTDWILRLDADEYLLPELREEMQSIVPFLPSQVTGLYMKRRMVFQGRWIRHGAVYPLWLLRAFRTGKGRAERLEMDEHIVVIEGETQRLRNDFVDHNQKGLSFWARKHMNYADREARVLLRHERDALDGLGEPGRLTGDPRERRRWRKQNLYLRCPLFVRALLYFLYRYFIRLGVLDGTEGLVYHFLQGFWYRFYVDARLWELRRG